MRILTLAALLALALPAHAGQFMAGDLIVYWRGCNTAESVGRVLEQWAEGRALVEWPEDCFQTSRPAKAVLIERAGIEHTLPDGSVMEVWSIVDQLGDHEFTGLRASGGTHEGI